MIAACFGSVLKQKPMIFYRRSKSPILEGTRYEDRSSDSSTNRTVWSKMYHGPLKSRRDYNRAIPSRSSISFFFCFRSRYRQPGRITRLRRLWQDGLLREARYARLLHSLARKPAFIIVHSSWPTVGPISNFASALENAICRSVRSRLAVVGSRASTATLWALSTWPKSVFQFPPTLSRISIRFTR